MRSAKWILKRVDYSEEITLSGQEEFPLGRSKDSYYTILSLCVSRRHCIFRISENGLTVKDLNSANGTFVNENKIPPMIDYGLRNSDRIGMGVPIVSGPDSYVFMLVQSEEKSNGNAFNADVKSEPTKDENKSSVVDDDVILIEEKEDIDIIDLSECIKNENDVASRKNATLFSSQPSGSGLQASPVDLNTTSVHINVSSKTKHVKEMPNSVVRQSIQEQETNTTSKTVPHEKINFKGETSNFINPDCEGINSDSNRVNVSKPKIKQVSQTCSNSEKCASEHKVSIFTSDLSQCVVKETKSQSSKQNSINNMEVNYFESKLGDKILNTSRYLDTSSSIIKKEIEKESVIDTNFENVRKNRYEYAKQSSNEICGKREYVSFPNETGQSEQPRNIENSSEIQVDVQIKKEILDNNERSELKKISTEILKQGERINTASFSKEVNGMEIGLKRPHEEQSSTSNTSTSNIPTSKKAKLDSFLNSEPNSSSSSSCSVRKSSPCDSPSQSNSENENPDKWFAKFSRPFLEQLEKKTETISMTSTSSSPTTNPKEAESVARDELKTIKTHVRKSKCEDHRSELSVKKYPLVVLRKIDDLIDKEQKKKYTSDREMQGSDNDLKKKKVCKTSVNITSVSVSDENHSKDSDSELESQSNFPSIINYSQSDDVIVIDDDEDNESDNLEKEIINHPSHQKNEEVKVSKIASEEICVKEEIFDDEEDVPEDDDDDDETFNWVCKLSQSLSPSKEEHQSPCPPTTKKRRIFTLYDSSDEDLPLTFEKDREHEVNIHKDIEPAVGNSDEEINNLSLKSSSKNKKVNKTAELESDIQDDNIFEDDMYSVSKMKQHENKNTKPLYESAVGRRNEIFNSSEKKSSDMLVYKSNISERELNSSKTCMEKCSETGLCVQKQKNIGHKKISDISEERNRVKPPLSKNGKTINQPSNRRTTLLDCALPMKTKSRHKRTKSTEITKTAGLDEESRKEVQNSTIAMVSNSKDKLQEIQDTRTSSSSNNILLSDKNRVREDRKAKLKALTAQKCEITTLEKTESKAPPKSTYRPKNTLLSRADKLAESLVTSKNSSKQKKEKIKVKVVIKKNENNALQVTNVSSSGEMTSRNVEVSSRVSDSSNMVPNISKSIVNIPDSTSSKKPEFSQANSSVSDIEKQVKKLSFKDLPKIPKRKTSDSSSSKSHTIVREESNRLTLRSSLKLNSVHSKKRVTFASGKNLCTVHSFEIDAGNTLRRIEGKDAPIRKVLADQAETLYDSSQMVLKHVITLILQFWNPRWIIEESIIAKNRGEPPPAHCQKVHVSSLYPMLTSFSNYDEYLKIVEPLMLLDLWAQVSEDARRPNERTKAKYDISLNDIKEANESNGILTLHCSMPISLKQDREKRHPHVGDLCVIRYLVTSSSNVPQGESSTKTSDQDKYYERFAYVESLTRDYFRPGNWSQGNSPAVPPHCNLNFVIKMKGGTKLILIHPTLKVISSIRSELRTFEAVGFLKHTRLCKMILNPCVADYNLSNIKISSHLMTKDSLNESQKNAVLTCAAACLRHSPKLCLIQGPPGTGKTKVIVNIIKQILYSDNQYSKQRWDKKTRILLCAPSNAAADELVERLLVVRSEMPKELRFKMVRAGPLEYLREKVRGVSVDELAKKDVDATLAHQMYSLESVELEISTLEARRRSYVMAYEHAAARKENTGMYEKKIKETERRIADLRGPSKNVPCAKTAEMERESRRKILSHADIVVSTLSSSFNSQMTEVFASRNGRSIARFTCCIIDEATQCKEPECLIPLMFGIERIIMVGDPEQLPATILSQVAKGKSFGQSLFNRIWNKFLNEAENPVIFLNTQYRMHPEIYKWPNEYIYNGRVISDPSVYFRTPLKPYCVFAHNFEQVGQSLVNYNEAQLVTDIAKTLAFAFPELLKTIGIITPYHKQLQEIKNLVGESTSNVSILVNTIDGFQGRECDVIIFSCVRTRGLGFMGESQRLNVALTRARVSLIICGNFVSLQDDKMWSSLLADAMKRKIVIDAHNKSINRGNVLQYFMQHHTEQ